MTSRHPPGSPADASKAALRGTPSYVWRAGQERRLNMILAAAEGRERGRVFVDGCGVGQYLARLGESAHLAVGLDIEWERTREAYGRHPRVVCGAGEALPFPAHTFDLVLSHEVIEHVADDRQTLAEIARVLAPGGRLVLFCPNRGYPFETHGIYWRGRYRFGNIPLVNYLPQRWRDRLAPHVRVYSSRDLDRLIAGLPLRVVQRTIIFGAYDNIIARFPRLGRLLRAVLQALEKTPLRLLGLSHFWVLEKITP
ncbi:hypothetical protein SE15_09410 [Thermanaerothrix daxensis]|uniref:Methyltransferase type 11 domain-containing protein n=1 Tax=Thermanaerothrix daxensis TaxID=869279 RepID=A0A0P6XTQ2_9CHLR|nr:methyltransferase domain-containing protein [Thermanaerothrix daxensis]KPL82381.1 hypothetical protein SE15_09410 [Thermanaerothrix daxensis]